MSDKLAMMRLRFAQLRWLRRLRGGVGPQAELGGGVGTRMCACGGKHFSTWISVAYLQAMMIGGKGSHPSVQTAAA